MKSKKIKFDFSHEDIMFVKKVIRQGELDGPDKQQMKTIYQNHIDPTYDPCEGCHQVIKENFKRLVQIMCESLGVSDLRFYKPKPQVQPVAKKEEVKPEDQTKDNQDEPKKKESLLDKIGKALRI